MCETLKFGESLLRFITIPHLNSLWCIKAKINSQEKRDNSARSAFHWQLLKCRLLIFTLDNVLACPVSQSLFEIHVIISKIDLEDGRLQALLEKFDMTLEGPIAVSPEIYEICLRYTISAKMAPHWNPIGSESLAKGRDFLKAKSFGTVHTEYKVANATLTLSLRSSYVQMPHMTMSYLGFSTEMLERAWSTGNAITDMDLTGQWVYVLPSLRKGRVMAIWNIIPPNCPYKSYKEIRRHWKNAYGYRLPEDEGNMLFLEVYFRPLGSTFFTYPDLCVRPYFPRPCRPNPQESEGVLLDSLLIDMNKLVKNICGSPFRASPEHAKVTMDILPATQIENNTGANRQLITDYNKIVTPINNMNRSQLISVNTNPISLCTPTQNNMSACDLYDLPSTNRANNQSNNCPISQILNENLQVSAQRIDENGPNKIAKIKPQFNVKKHIAPVFIPSSAPLKTQEAKVLPYAPMFNRNKTYSDEIYDMENNGDNNLQNSPIEETPTRKFTPLFNTNKSKVIGVENSTKEVKTVPMFKRVVPLYNNSAQHNILESKVRTTPKQSANTKQKPAKPKSGAPVLFTECLLSGTQKLETATVASLQNWLKSQGVQTKSKYRKAELIEKSLQILQSLRSLPSTGEVK